MPRYAETHRIRVSPYGRRGHGHVRRRRRGRGGLYTRARRPGGLRTPGHRPAYWFSSVNEPAGGAQRPCAHGDEALARVSPWPERCSVSSARRRTEPSFGTTCPTSRRFRGGAGESRSAGRRRPRDHASPEPRRLHGHRGRRGPRAGARRKEGPEGRTRELRGRSSGPLESRHADLPPSRSVHAAYPTATSTCVT